MRKCQLFFEFIVIFAVMLLIFLVFLAFFPASLEKLESTEKLAQRLANEIKVKLITASLADADYEGTVPIPSRLNAVDIKLVIFKSPENAININDTDTGKILARAFTPKIDTATIIDPYGATLEIKKNYAANSVSVTLK